MRTLSQYASDLVEVLLNAKTTGKYYDGRTVVPSSALSQESQWIDALWALSVQLSGVDWPAKAV